MSETEALSCAALLSDLQEASYLQLTTIGDPLSCWDSALRPEQRKQATVLLQKLAKRNRLLTCADVLGGSHHANCSASPLSCPVELRSVLAAVVKSPRGTIGCASQSLDSYIASELSSTLKRTELPVDATSSMAHWETTILNPLFRFARKLTFVDRLMGDKWLQNPGFRKSFLWLLESARKFETPGRLESVNLFTTVRDKASYQELNKVCERFGVLLMNRSYKPASSDSLPHARYIISDSMGLRIDQGLDLIFGQQVVATKIAVEGNCETVIAQCKAAPKVTAA